MKNKILIVGGAGYIGSQVNKYLNLQGYETVVFDNLSTGFKKLALWGDFFKGDLKNPNELKKCFTKYKFDAVMHFAALASVGDSVKEPAIYYRNNVVNTINLLDCMRAFDVKKLIFSSTCAVYGEVSMAKIKENFPKNPINPYGRTKLIVEKVMEDYSKAYGLRFVALRYFNASGADPDCEVGELHNPEKHIIPLVLEVAVGKRPQISVFGDDYKTPDGTCVRDYIHTDDLAQAHFLALEYLKKGGKSAAFNLGNDKGFSVLDIIKTAEKVTGKTIKIKFTERRAGDPAVLVSSSSLIKKTLGWKPKYSSIKTIISHAWNWYVSNNVK